MTRRRVREGQLDLFKVASVYRFPLHRMAALVRDHARTMTRKDSNRKREYYLNRECNYQFALLTVKHRLTPEEAAREVGAYRDRILAEFYKLIYSGPSFNSGDDAA